MAKSIQKTILQLSTIFAFVFTHLGHAATMSRLQTSTPNSPSSSSSSSSSLPTFAKCSFKKDNYTFNIVLEPEEKEEIKMDSDLMFGDEPRDLKDGGMVDDNGEIRGGKKDDFKTGRNPSDKKLSVAQTIAELQKSMRREMAEMQGRVLKAANKIEEQIDRRMADITYQIRLFSMMPPPPGGEQGGVPLPGPPLLRSGGPYHCPPKFLADGDGEKCYSFSTFPVNWYEAREFCSAFSASLLSIDQAKEQYLITWLIKDNPDHRHIGTWWTGGNAQTGKWMWASTLHLKPFTFDRWAEGQWQATTDDACMTLDSKDNYHWFSSDCNNLKNFICEFSLKR